MEFNISFINVLVSIVGFYITIWITKKTISSNNAQLTKNFVQNFKKDETSQYNVAFANYLISVLNHLDSIGYYLIEKKTARDDLLNQNNYVKCRLLLVLILDKQNMIDKKILDHIVKLDISFELPNSESGRSDEIDKLKFLEISNNVQSILEEMTNFLNEKNLEERTKLLG